LVSLGIFGCLILPGKIGIWRAKNGDQLDQALGDGLKKSETLTFLLTIWGEWQRRNSYRGIGYWTSPEMDGT